MILPYVYDSRTNISRVVDNMEEQMNRYKEISINSVHEIINIFVHLQSTIEKPKWMKEYESCYMNEKYGWTEKDFDICIKFIRWNCGSGYVIELSEPIQFV